MEERYLYKLSIPTSPMKITSLDILIGKKKRIKDKKFRKAIRLFEREFLARRGGLEQFLNASIQWETKFERAENEQEREEIYGVGFKLRLSDPINLAPEVAYKVQDEVSTAIHGARISARAECAQDCGVNVETKDFNSPLYWDYLLEESSDKGFVKVEISGLADGEAYGELTRISDKSYFPSRVGDRWLTRLEGGRVYFCDAQWGENAPTIVVFKNFKGEFDPEKEKMFMNFFEEIKRISQEHQILPRFIDSPAGMAFKAELAKRKINPEYELEHCSLGVQGNYTPAASIEFSISSQDHHMRVSGISKYQDFSHEHL